MRNSFAGIPVLLGNNFAYSFFMVSQGIISAFLIHLFSGFIGNSAFYTCNNLESADIPESVTSIGSNAFSYCKSLTSLTLPEGITTINGGTFSYCSNLESINIPDTVTKIGDTAFFGCNSLVSVTIPSDVTEIGIAAFSSCSKLISVSVKALTPPKIGNKVFPSNVKGIHVPSSKVSDYKNAWSDYADLIDGINKLADGKFIQTADKGDTHYIRYVFVKPLSEIEGKKSAVFTAKYGDITKTFTTDKYYTSMSTNSEFYIPASETSGMFVVTITGVSKENQSKLSCDLKFE